MATATPTLVTVLRETADRLENGVEYRWAHQGRCNCGQLIQTATGLGAAEIYERAMRKPGEWSEHAVDYCPVSHHPLDDVIDALREIGFSARDLAHVEYLNDPVVCRVAKKTAGKRYLDYRNREDVVLYFRVWADLLAADLPPEEPETPTRGETSLSLPVLPDLEPAHGHPRESGRAPTAGRGHAGKKTAAVR